MTILSGKVLYKERVLPSSLFYLATLILPVSLILVALPFSELVGFLMAGVSIPLILGLTWLAAPLITITDAELRVGSATIERKYLGEVEIITASNAFKERGVLLDSRAHTKFQIGIRESVKLEIRDEQDPTPYWLIATRNPEIMAGLLKKN